LRPMLNVLKYDFLKDEKIKAKMFLSLKQVRKFNFIGTNLSCDMNRYSIYIPIAMMRDIVEYFGLTGYTFPVPQLLCRDWEILRRKLDALKEANVGKNTSGWNF
jgi:hypothetical protein